MASRSTPRIRCGPILTTICVAAFRIPKGGMLRIDATVLDASDGDSRSPFALGAMGAKSSSARAPPAWRTRPHLGTTLARRGPLLGVDPLKAQILGMLAAKARMIRFSRSLAGNDDYFNRLVRSGT